MLPGPTSLYQCPNCDNQLSQESIMSGNTLGARVFSDGKMIARMLPDFPNLTKCEKCNHIFWLSKLEKTTSYRWGTIRNDGSKRVDRAKFLDLDDYYRAFDVGVVENKREACIVRKRIWWAYNDRIRSGVSIFQDEHDEKRWKENCQILQSLLDSSDVNQKMMIAEIHRNLGHFEACITILQSISNEKLQWAKDLMILECQQKNKWVVELQSNT